MVAAPPIFLNFSRLAGTEGILISGVKCSSNKNYSDSAESNQKDNFSGCTSAARAFQADMQDYYLSYSKVKLPLDTQEVFVPYWKFIPPGDKLPGEGDLAGVNWKIVWISYANCTKLTLATPSTWNDTHIQATIRQGMFSAGETAYVFVVNGSGNMSVTGRPVVFSGAGADPAPAAPVNLRTS